MIGRPKGTTLAKAVGPQEAIAHRTTRGRSRHDPGRTAEAQEGGGGQLQGGAASQGQAAHQEGRKAAKSQGAGSGTAPGAGAGTRGMREPRRHGRATGARRSSDHGPKEVRVRAKVPNAKKGSRSTKPRPSGAGGRRASPIRIKPLATARPQHLGKQRGPAPQEEDTDQDRKRKNGSANKKGPG
eukprot:8563185-Heterocapsa_arctica.AAC.1